MKSIKRALISVSDKKGVLEFAKELHNFGIEILSTGGTAELLRKGGVPVIQVSDYTGFPEMMDGRIKTLHPRVHGGILARRDAPDHMKVMDDHGIRPIDLVVINLYPFEKTVAKKGSTLEEAIPQLKPRLTIQSGEPIKLAGEIYGLRNGETLNTRIGIARENVGIFRRLGEFMRLLESDTPTEMSFQDINIDGIGTVFRAIHIDLPDLETGHYTITVELEPSGREKMLLSRNIEVVN